ncbi:MAG TPA: WecB/TagA/CpsF family glycosyltransferase [Polyangiaceae bacterium]|nr:WecB/TagA/CpsF family glycosyltransferase [Polyangiaceae bacterium]
MNVFGMRFDPVRIEQAVARVVSMAKTPGAPRYVVTPNVDHVLIIRKDARFRKAYDEAAMVLADGWPVVLGSRMLGEVIPERVAGSDLAPGVFAAANPADPLRVFLCGAMPGVADRAARIIEDTYPGVRIVGTHSPPFGFETDATENRAIFEKLAAAKPELLILGFGSPKQEIWVNQHLPEVTANVVLCVGATIDFIANEQRRAPSFLRRIGLEWAFRMMLNPKRLGPRYATNAVEFPKIVLREWLDRRSAWQHR